MHMHTFFENFKNRKIISKENIISKTNINSKAKNLNVTILNDSPGADTKIFTILIFKIFQTLKYLAVT